MSQVINTHSAITLLAAFKYKSCGPFMSAEDENAYCPYTPLFSTCKQQPPPTTTILKAVKGIIPCKGVCYCIIAVLSYMNKICTVGE